MLKKLKKIKTIKRIDKPDNEHRAFFNGHKDNKVVFTLELSIKENVPIEQKKEIYIILEQVRKQLEDIIRSS